MNAPLRVPTSTRTLLIFSFDEHATAHALLQATNGLLPYSLSTTELGERDEVEQRAADVANLMLRGLLSRDRTTDERRINPIF
jgi:hypothetical protein